MAKIREIYVRAANSFTREEVNWLNQVFSAMARGGDVTALRHRKEYRHLYQKVLRMQAKLDASEG